MNNEIQPSYYAIIPATIRYDKRLKFAEGLFYGEITALIGKEGYCFASNNIWKNYLEKEKLGLVQRLQTQST